MGMRLNANIFQTVMLDPYWAQACRTYARSPWPHKAKRFENAIELIYDAEHLCKYNTNSNPVASMACGTMFGENTEENPRLQG